MSLSMHGAVVASLLLSVVLSACRDSNADSSEASTGASIPVGLRCQLHYRPVDDKGEPQSAPNADAGTRVVDVAPNKSGSTDLMGLRLSAENSVSSTEGTAFVVTVHADGKPLLKILRQFDSADPVLRKFGANHGFTGLIYLSHPHRAGDYQMFCGTTLGSR